MVIRSFSELEATVRGRAPLRVVVAGGEDQASIAAVQRALAQGLIGRAILIGNAAAIRSLVTPGDQIVIEHAPDVGRAAAQAVAAIHAGEGDVLMKGAVDSAAYLRAVVARETGLRVSPVLSNVTLAEMPSLGRLIGATDNGIVPLPDLEQKRALIRNAVPLFRGLGITPMKVAAIAASEKVSTAQPATADAAALAQEFAPGALSDAIVDGPFGYDVALSRAAAEKKGFAGSSVAGQADLILFPSIEAGNATVKAWKLHGQARTASIVMGARVPILLNSRADLAEQRQLGLLLAALVQAGSTTQ